jgi:hypothetical protein
MKTFKDLEFEKTDMGGIHAHMMFDNNYGISCISGPYTKGGIAGLYEIAVIKFPLGEKYSVLCYDTPITNDVIGHLKADMVTDYMRQIQELPNAHTNE